MSWGVLKHLNPFLHRQRAAVSKRRGLSNEEFRALYGERGEVVMRFADVLWKELQRYSVEEPYGVHPDDSLLDLYGITPDEAAFIMKTLVPSIVPEYAEAVLTSLPITSIATLGELVAAFSERLAQAQSSTGATRTLDRRP